MTDPELSDQTYIEPITKEFIEEIIKIEKLAKQGDAIVVVAGMPFGVSGSTNSIRVVDI